MSGFDALDADQAGLLSDAALSALQLRQQPFSSAPADGDWFTDGTTTDQLSDIKEALITGDDLLLILGPAGAGKSTLLNQLAANSGQRIQCFSVRGSARFSTDNLFTGMLEAFKIKPADDLKLVLDELIPCLQGMSARNTLSAIVLDDANKIPQPELTKLLSGMLYVNSRDETLMRVALAADEAFEAQIPDLLPEGANLPYSSLTIEPFDNVRTREYLEFRLNQAGFFEEFPFSDKEISHINQQSSGIPAQLHAIAANELNLLHGPLDELTLPAELRNQTSATMHSSGGKFALGMLAMVLIAAGLWFFKPAIESTDESRYTVVENRKIDTLQEAERLRLIEEKADEPDVVSQSPSTTDTISTDASKLATDTDAATEIAGEADTDNQQSSTSAIAPAASSDNSATTASAQTGSAPSGESEVPAIVADSSQESATNTPSVATPAIADAPADTTPEPTTDAAAAVTAQAEAVTEPAASTAANSSAARISTTESEQTSQPTPAAALADSQLESPNWILVQKSEQFTVQMSASTDRKSVESFLNRSELKPPNSIFSFNRNDITWYALVHGLYPSIAEARAAIDRMPAAARSNQPWIRAVGRIQSALKEQN